MRQLLLSLICLSGVISTASAQNAIPRETVTAIKNATVYIKVPIGEKLATGTGWVMKVEGKTGYLVTNHHVVTDAPKPRGVDYPVVTVVFHSGTERERAVPAEVLVSQPEPDLAILKVTDIKDLPRPIDFGRPTELVETMPVVVFGFPFTGLEGGKNPTITVTRGSVSRIRRDGIVQLDANFNPGNSGGPVVDIEGRLVGIAFARPQSRDRDQGPITGIGLAIPPKKLTRLLHGFIGDYAIVSKKVHVGAADIEIDVRLIDPLEQIKAVTLHYARADDLTDQKAVADLPGARKLELKVDKQRARGSFSVSSAERGVVLFYCQASCVNGAGETIVGDPLPWHVHFPKHTSDDAGERVAFSRDIRSEIYAMAFSPDGAILATGSNWSRTPLTLWQVDKGWRGTTPMKVTGKDRRVFSLAFSPDGKKLVSASRSSYPQNPELHLWDVAEGKERWRIDMNKMGAWQVAFSPDGKMVAVGGTDNEVTFWAVADGKPLEGLKVPREQRGGYRYPIDSLAFAPDGRTLATGGRDGKLRLWDMASRKEVATLDADKETIHSLAWTPDGKTLASAGHEGKVKLWDVATWKERSTLEHNSPVLSVAFNSDGTLLASTSRTGGVRLWHVESGRELTTLTAERDSSRCVVFSPDDWFVAGGSDRTGSQLTVWRLARALEQTQSKE